MISLLGCDRQKILDWLAKFSYPAYRADQILQWVYRRPVNQWAAMSNLPQKLQRQLAADFYLHRGQLLQKLHSLDGTVKLLLRWPDGDLTESVLIAERRRRTVCVSSQVGCASV